MKKFIILLAVVYVVVDQGPGKPKSPQIYEGNDIKTVCKMLKDRKCSYKVVTKSEYDAAQKEIQQLRNVQN